MARQHLVAHLPVQRGVVRINKEHGDFNNVFAPKTTFFHDADDIGEGLTHLRGSTGHDFAIRVYAALTRHDDAFAIGVYDNTLAVIGGRFGYFIWIENFHWKFSLSGCELRANSITRGSWRS